MINATKQEAMRILGRCEVFLGLDDNDLERIASLPLNTLVSFETGEIISIEGAPATNLYILVEGKVDLRMRVQLDITHKGTEITVDTVTSGSIFDWSSLVRPYILSRTSVCTESCKVLSINGKELIELMNSNEHIGYEIMQSIAYVVASRLRAPNNYFWAESLRRNAQLRPLGDNC